MSEPRDPNEKPDAEDKAAADAARRPISVREAAAPAAPRPVRPLRSGDEGRSDSGGRSRGGKASPDREGADSSDDDGRRPTPVRAAMGLPREDGPSADAPRRTVRLGPGEGEEWVVRVEGRGRTGQPPDAGAPLLFLTFAPGDDPDHPERETLAVGEALDGLSEAQLEELFERSRPLSSRDEPAEIFPGTRRSRGGRRR